MGDEGREEGMYCCIPLRVLLEEFPYNHSRNLRLVNLLESLPCLSGTVHVMLRSISLN
jgi:hypothetical protein